MDWRRALLRSIGAPPSQENLTFLSTWQRWEGGHTNNNAKFNWLNTTHGKGQSINSVGVKAFPSFKAGIQALTETLNNGRYPDILKALSAGNPYALAPSAGLQTWVSGKPDGNPGYAAKILGGYSGGTAKRDIGVPALPPMQAPSFDPDFKLAKVLFGFDKSFIADMENLRLDANRHVVTPAGNAAARGGGLTIPMSWKGTHVTDRLGWDTHTAKDFMADPGTPVRLAEDVTVVYYHPEGAQGGGSMLLRTKSGREYWVGHIASDRKAGERIRAGSPIAVVANQKVSAPHAHVDRRG